VEVRADGYFERILLDIHCEADVSSAAKIGFSIHALVGWQGKLRSRELTVAGGLGRFRFTRLEKPLEP